MNRPVFKLEGFSTLDNFQDKLRFLINFAVLAPSSHNTQPWLFKIKGSQIDILLNKKRKLSASDSNGRQAYISLGACLENLIIAADFYNFTYRVELFPDANNLELVARLTFDDRKDFRSNTNTNLNFITALINRCNNRFEYEDRHIPNDFISEISKLMNASLRIDFINDDDRKNKIIEITLDAIENAFGDPEFRKELSHWIKPSLNKYKDGMPGYNIGIPWPVSFIMPFVMRYVNVAKKQRQMDEKPLRKTPSFAIISTAGDGSKEWLSVGMVFEHICVEAEKREISTGVMVAPIQIGDYYKEIKNILSSDLRPQIFFRIGYCDKKPIFSPRLNIDDVIIR